ncbi:hypothetical protein Val02_62330 [Virgisporangium aliadipatigenens]|uniref:HTH arsR-type domain-containing protein n=1 Tax=Virgisporangium aliadipatigenens TaxID=741659 RepID=A0A8J4DUN6_9ACTN|nr:helix-turn-helix domain-containing protein [Virgisporangium aliadipatigenens]GIJ49347.1 hypothetical protein Val02_62330 [Virgisporangium aliadipatigenens]
MKDVQKRLDELAKRVSALEKAAPPAPTANATGWQDLTPETFVYGGLGGWDERTIAWQIARGWDEIRAAPAEPSAGVLAALGNPTRVRIVAELLRRRLTTAELARLLDQPSSGQLFHHLKELLAAGVIHQPVRGTYAVREHHVVPLLAVLCAVMDLRPSVAEES